VDGCAAISPTTKKVAEYVRARELFEQAPRRDSMRAA